MEAAAFIDLAMIVGLAMLLILAAVALGVAAAARFVGRPIPTLLGNDSGNGNTSGYGNDHPVGTGATLGAARLWTNNATTSPLTVTVCPA